MVCPALNGTRDGDDGDDGVPSPVFSLFQVALPSFDGITDEPCSVTLVRPAPMPPREIPLAPSGKAQEPTMDDWLDGAAIYNVTLPPAPAVPTSPDDDYVEVRVAVDFEADAARLYSPRGRLLTDNFFTGYAADGRMEVGLTFLADENPGMFDPLPSAPFERPRGTNVTLFVLPLKKTTLEAHAWLQTRYWPTFARENGSVALRVGDVRPIVVVGTKLTL